MAQSVKDKFMDFTKKHEGGAIDYMFLDNLGRIGTAYGIDLDYNVGGRSRVSRSRRQGLPKALSLEWVFRGTTQRASDAEVTSAWETIKATPLPPKTYTCTKKKRSCNSRKSMKDRVNTLRDLNERVLKQNAAFKNFRTLACRRAIGGAVRIRENGP